MQTELLAKFHILSTNLVEKAQWALSQELTDLKIIRVADRSDFHLKMNGLKIGETSLVIRLGTDIRFNQGNLETLSFL